MTRTFTRANIARVLLLGGFLLFTFVPLYWMLIT
jgi:ABC-type glycerol-3-phosphate transport system permease component